MGGRCLARSMELHGSELYSDLMNDVTEILTAIEQGDLRAADELLPAVYDELRVLAAQKLAREKPEQTLQATALVHEAYLRLVGSGTSEGWNGRAHFFGAAAEAMRRILIDRARARKTQRRGGHLKRKSLGELQPAIQTQSDDLLALDDALKRLEEVDHRKAALVKLRYFAGLTVPQAADVLGVSPATADRDWAYARAWLHAEIADIANTG